MKRLILSLLVIICFSQGIYSQSAISKFCKLSRPEKFWVIAHPFVAGRALKASKIALSTTDSIFNSKTLDGDRNGGQVDAFRHAYWMICLCQQINFKKSEKLGIAHEKGNYLDFKKRQMEDGSVPDSVSCEMDLRNNSVGITIFKNNQDLSQKSIINLLIQEILNGKLWIMYKDKQGTYYNCKGEPIQSIDKKWNTQRCLAPSNILYPTPLPPL